MEVRAQLSGTVDSPPGEPYFLLPTVLTEQVARIITTIILVQFNCDFLIKWLARCCSEVEHQAKI